MNKEKIEELKEFKTNKDGSLINFNVPEFMEFIYKNDLEKYTTEIYSEASMEEYLHFHLDESGWLTIKNMLSDITDVTEDYYIIDGYGCFQNITNDDINGIIESIEYDYKYEGFEL